MAKPLRNPTHQQVNNTRLDKKNEILQERAPDKAPLEYVGIAQPTLPGHRKAIEP
jgi:hypothetical protein